MHRSSFSRTSYSRGTEFLDPSNSHRPRQPRACLLDMVQLLVPILLLYRGFAIMGHDSVRVPRLGGARGTSQAPSRTGLVSVVSPHRTGLELPGRLSFDAWQDVGRHLAAIIDTSAWWLADWLVFGQEHYPGRYDDAIRKTSLDYQTLRNYAWVARRISLPRRRDTLSFAHHAEVAALPFPEQDYWLRQAERYQWSRNILRRELRASLKDRKQQPQNARDALEAASPPKPTRTLSLHVSSEQLSICLRAATVDHADLQEWAIGVLQDEASRTLREGQ